MEMEIPLDRALPSGRHSRARGNLGLFRIELAWIPAFAGMTKPRRPLRSADHPAHVFSKEPRSAEIVLCANLFLCVSAVSLQFHRSLRNNVDHCRTGALTQHETQ